MGSDEAHDRLPIAARWETIARLASGLSHEVRNPLNALAIHLEVVADKLRREGNGVLPPHLEKNLLAARAQVDRVDGIVRRFADFAAAREWGPAEVELSPLLQAVGGLCRHEAGRHGVGLLVDAPEGLLVAASEPALAQALVALVFGLVDGGVGGERLLLGARVEAGRAVLTVAAQGDGLDVAVARGAIAGTVEQIVAGFGGEVTVEATAEAAVVLRLPLAGRERTGVVA